MQLATQQLQLQKWGVTREFFLATFVALQVARKIASCNMALSVKRLFSCHDTKKRRSVAGGTDSPYPVNVKSGLQTADWGKMRTEGKMQTVDVLTESCYRFHH